MKKKRLSNKKIFKFKMLSRAITSITRPATKMTGIVPTLNRGVYTKETMPHVFINQHTKVLVQGMTGKHGTFHTK
jgi:hypothetical protein